MALAYLPQEDTMTESRKQFTAEQKVAILRRHLIEHTAVSDLCDEYHIQPSMFYRWHRHSMPPTPL